MYLLKGRKKSNIYLATNLTREENMIWACVVKQTDEMSKAKIKRHARFKVQNAEEQENKARTFKIKEGI